MVRLVDDGELRHIAGLAIGAGWRRVGALSSVMAITNMSDPGADSELGHGSGKSVGPVWRHATDDALAWMEGREMAKRH